MKKILLCLLLLLAVQPARALDWNAQKGDFVFCLLNSSSGFWVGTEDNGLWRRDARGAWKQFTVADGLGGDTVRCLLERDGQIWAGTARDGLSIWDGARWENIGVDDGLPSGRVNDLALDEQSGDVWVATDFGLCKWNDNGGWTVIDAAPTRRQIVALACARGNVWAATACDGLLKSADRGQSWTAIHGAATQPTTATGDGLPSEILNDVAVDELGQIWVATDFGLARSNDEGASWFWVRGADWRDNVSGSAAGLKPDAEEAGVEPPGEDWVQTLAPDGNGHIWLGFRQQDVEVRDITSGELVFATRFAPGKIPAPAKDWARAIVPQPNGRAIVARYGGGGLEAILGANFPAPLAPKNAAQVALPGALPALDARQIAQLATPTIDSKAALWDMDYRTHGDWIGRYGDSAAFIYERPWERIFQRDKTVEISTEAGDPVVEGASPIYGHVAFDSSNNPDVLYNPAIGTRRMAEINDGTWQHDIYPYSHEGPGLQYSVVVPAGVHRVAFYFYNNDAHEVIERGYRDYIVHIRDANQQADAPDFARCRVSDFAGGVYAGFVVSGPGQYTIKIARHRSEATKISGVFVDRIGNPIAAPQPMPAMRGVDYSTRPVPNIANENATVAAARAAWQKLDSDAAQGKIAPGAWQTRHQLLRAATAAGADETLLFNWRWKLGIWTREDRENFGDVMAQIENKRVATGAAKTR